MSPATQQDPLAETAAAGQWQQLSARMIYVDLAQSLLSLAPAVLALWIFTLDTSPAQIWPLWGLAAAGVIGAMYDAWRWVFTRYRITESQVEIKTGLLLRRHRSIQRDRIRSVDIQAKLRHRVGRLRVVQIGAGQQSSAGESALLLDALSVHDALALQQHLRTNQVPAATAAQLPDAPEATAPQNTQAHSSAELAPQVLVSFRPGWFIYNMFNIWAFVIAAGLSWGLYWLLTSINIDVNEFILALADWEALGVLPTILIALLALGIFGALGMGVSFFPEYWNFELARVHKASSTMLRTRRGLFTTVEINRDEQRVRGLTLSEPVLWRWLGVCDSHLVTTGLDVHSMSDPAAILPRGPRKAHWATASQILAQSPDPFAATLNKHPAAALRRRLVWAAGISAFVSLVLGALVYFQISSPSVLWVLAVLWPLSLLAAFVAYRALGHGICGDYLVTRSGLLARATTVLQRSSVSTIVIRESLLQRRLRLRTVSAKTAAGYGAYDTPDIPSDHALDFARQCAPGILEPFVVRRKEQAANK